MSHYHLPKMSFPPKTKRYCLACEKMTNFKYNRNKLHSECLECGGFLCKKEKPKVET